MNPVLHLNERDIMVIHMIGIIADHMTLPATGQLDQFYRFADAMIEARHRIDLEGRDNER